MSTEILNFGRDAQGMNAYAPKTAGNKYSATITVGLAASLTVPSNFATWIVAFSFQPGTSVWVDMTGHTAAVPAGATFASTTSELNPAARTVLAGTVISFITGNTSADVGVSFYAVQ